MAGVKGRSGGARPNSGPKPKPKPKAAPVAKSTRPGGDAVMADGELPRDPLEFLLDVMQGRHTVDPMQVRAAIAAAQYKHHKSGDGGKKDAQNEAAKKVAGRFSASAPPKLVAAGGRKV